LQYLVPDILTEYLKPDLSFRGAVGYELKQFRFAVESGYSHFLGTNPLVLDISFVPLVFKFGYTLPLFSIIGIQADLGIGFAFSETHRYETAIDVAMKNLIIDNERSLFTGARFYLTVSPFRFLKIYAGGGIDAILENDGPIPLPLLEAGLSLKPLMIVNDIKEARENKKNQRSRLIIMR